MLRLVLAILLGVFASGRVAAQPIDRGAVLVELCGSAQDSLAGLRRVLNGAAHAPAADQSWALQVVQAFTAKALRCGDDDRDFLSLGPAPRDALTLAPAEMPAGLRAPLPSLRARVVLDQVTAALTLLASPAPRERLAATQTLARRSADLPDDLVATALANETDPGVASALRALQAEAGLHAADPARRIAAIGAIAESATSATATRLAGLQGDKTLMADPAVAAALDRAIAQVHRQVLIGNVLSVLYNGVSAGSVLFLSSVGLAIIFGLMGVINLAQGELIMIGAYVTYCVQQALQAVAPGWVQWYPLVAIPIVFAVTALVGVAIEVAVIRHLYRRPLMTLLATWAISLLLVNLVRVGFGTQNLQFLTPSWLTGGVNMIGDFLVTWNHLFAIVFAVLALLATAALLRLTDMGLFIRAVTQNRDMAGCVGVSTRRIDMAAFGFGAGLAGLGGLALSPIYNVNPTMGGGFIIDSFMVVVLGGVGRLLGTAVASLGVGLVNVGIEPFYGAVAAKVIALLLIILIIQWRPSGLIAARGRR